MKKSEFVSEIEKIEEHEKFFFDHLPECKKRQYAGLEAMKTGYNGTSLIAKKFGINKHTVRKGKKELLARILPPFGKIRQKGGGRKKKL
jgi:DNA invertase Pin-like site-specific DNA recombinase